MMNLNPQVQCGHLSSVMNLSPCASFPIMPAKKRIEQYWLISNMLRGLWESFKTGDLLNLKPEDCNVTLAKRCRNHKKGFYTPSCQHE